MYAVYLRSSLIPKLVFHSENRELCVDFIYEQWKLQKIDLKEVIQKYTIEEFNYENKD